MSDVPYYTLRELPGPIFKIWSLDSTSAVRTITHGVRAYAEQYVSDMNKSRDRDPAFNAGADADRVIIADAPGYADRLAASLAALPELSLAEIQADGDAVIAAAPLTPDQLKLATIWAGGWKDRERTAGAMLERLM